MLSAPRVDMMLLAFSKVLTVRNNGARLSGKMHLDAAYQARVDIIEQGATNSSL